MPRKRQTIAGDAAQAVSPVAHQEYGMGVEQAQLQAAMPLPQTGPEPTPTMTFVEPGTPATQPRQGLDADRIAAIAAKMQGSMGALTKPTQRPYEPVTAGLRSGPGAGPEALQARTGNMTGEMLRRLAIAAGDPKMRALADQAGV